ncbi:uncharacterized protein CLUP02_02467 [Colletotrichum lupini]|uniref:Uncharacterized protein n=1 Tax=Colletotrichum lupini TaxID=145971 RepID=A0A9Q8WBD8_9PEZI|nr:uncharacterized protein CLUP02_02467 [Colletotrichum lupini]UQC77001.1 hypothetical protein CLUP02_02467 [Colletotrichum lupini]
MNGYRSVHLSPLVDRDIGYIRRIGTLKLTRRCDRPLTAEAFREKARGVFRGLIKLDVHDSEHDSLPGPEHFDFVGKRSVRASQARYLNPRLVNRHVAVGRDRLIRDTADRSREEGGPYAQRPKLHISKCFRAHAPVSSDFTALGGLSLRVAVRYFGQDEMPRERSRRESGKPRSLPSYKPVHKSLECRNCTIDGERWLCTFGALLRDCAGEANEALEVASVLSQMVSFSCALLLHVQRRRKKNGLPAGQLLGWHRRDRYALRPKIFGGIEGMWTASESSTFRQPPVMKGGKMHGQGKELKVVQCPSHKRRDKKRGSHTGNIGFSMYEGCLASKVPQRREPCCCRSGIRQQVTSCPGSPVFPVARSQVSTLFYTGCNIDGDANELAELWSGFRNGPSSTDSSDSYTNPVSYQ